MSDTRSTSCPACGARLAPETGACDLCGTPVDATALRQVEDAGLRARASDDEPSAGEADPSSHDEAVYCNACGWENPSSARFCSQCGERLQTVEGARPVAADLPRSDDPDDGDEGSPVASSEADGTSSMLTRQVGIIVGVALLLVVGLFVATTWSQRVDWGASDEPDAVEAPIDAEGGPASPPGAGGAVPGGGAAEAPADLETLVQQHAAAEMPEQLQNQVATLEAEIDQRSGEEQHAAQQKLVNLYIGAGAPGRAALVQRQMAEASEASEDWRRAGDLLYSWMETLEGAEPAPDIAEHAVDAYQAILDQQPDDLDVRTDMATAYLQTNNPMRGVEEINRVLEADPNHFQARFNKGIMLTMIGRAEDAIAEFEYVKEIVGSDSPYYQQADQAIQTIRARMR